MPLAEPASTEERLVRLLNDLGIDKAHFAARDPADWHGLASRYPERIASLTLICPARVDPAAVSAHASRLLVVCGDRGAAAESLASAVAGIDGATSLTLKDYESLMWSDIGAERGGDVGAAMLGFLARMDRRHALPPASLVEGEGEVAAISYRVRGDGPPLILLPLFLAPSQWEPLLPRLAERYCTITLGGAQLGAVAVLEGRGRSNYIDMVRSVIDLTGIRPGEAVLDVGCGSGVVLREVARRHPAVDRLIGVDVSPFLRREARLLVQREGYDDRVTFEQGRAEALPLASGSVDVGLSSTVIEEGDADRMLAELVRVTRPGGRIGVIVRAIDMPCWVNLPIGPAIRAKVQQPGTVGAGASPAGCADASLYRRFRALGLQDLQFFPQLTAIMPVEPRLAGLLAQAAAALDAAEMTEWRQAVAEAEAEGTLFIATPHHCAVGTKPG